MKIVRLFLFLSDCMVQRLAYLLSVKQVKEEIFGPIMAIQRFETEDEAIRLANDTAYGLAGALFSCQSIQTPLRWTLFIQALLTSPDALLYIS